MHSLDHGQSGAVSQVVSGIGVGVLLLSVTAVTVYVVFLLLCDDEGVDIECNLGKALHRHAL
jgi:hypothetical protein